MKEFTKKLIKEIKSKAVPLGFGLIPEDRVIREADAISVVERVAKEYSVTENDHDLMIVESLPSLYPLQDFEVEAIDRVVERGKHSGGWILCSERLPEEHEAERNIYSFIDSGFGAEVSGTEKYMVSERVICTVLECETEELFTAEDYTVNGDWHMFDTMGGYEVVAWQPLSDPFKG